MRINRYLAACGLGSRRSCEELVLAGRITVAGRLVHDLSTEVPEGARVACDDRPVEPPKLRHVLLFHKPKGCVCARRDPQGRRTVYDFLPPEFLRLAHVGRLDFASRGLLLLSDDGEIVERLTHPRYEHRKVYRVLLDAPLEPEDLAQLRHGGWRLPDDPRPLEPVVAKGDGVSLELTLKEGRNRQIRRMMEAMGREVIDLQRTAVGQWRLSGLEEGSWKLLADEDWRSLRHSLGLPPLPGDRSPGPARSSSPQKKRRFPNTRSR